jgi:adenine-specific DNA-methyltransferase
MSDPSVPQASTRLELTWPNKDKFLLVPKDADGKPVWVDHDHPAAHEVRLSDFTQVYGTVAEADPFADNLMFTGDSLDVLRILSRVPEYAKHYRGKVKLVCIDPPFNTGQTFTHYDDWMEHSTWLSFMRDRLLLIKDLLAADGSVWVHLDDAEVHRMRCLMDEVFGADNFVATIFLAWTPTFLVEMFGYSLGTAGLTGTLFIHLASALSAPLAGVAGRSARSSSA